MRTSAEIDAVMQTLRAFMAQGFDPMPLKKWDSVNPKTGKLNGNTPRDMGWVHADYGAFQWASWLGQGGNIAWRLQPDQLVLDLDPRNGGEQGLQALIWDMDSAPTDSVPYVLSGRGDGGTHYYFRKPMLVRTKITIPAYKGLDFKRGPGGYVLAPGSLHPKTGKPYTAGHTPIDRIAQAPDRLIQLIRQPDAPLVGQGEGGGEVTEDQLAKLLAVLDPADFGQGQHDKWVAMMMACHDATNGAGLQVWLDWCARDPLYGEEASEANTRRWISCEVGKVGPRATFRTLFHYVVEAGHPELVAEMGRGATVWEELEDTDAYSPGLGDDAPFFTPEDE